MRRIKILLALWLLPVFGLVGASYGSADVPAGGTNDGYRTSISAATGRGQTGSERDFHPAKHAVRSVSRRVGMASGSDGALHPDPIPAGGFAGLEPAAVSFRVVAAPPELARRWQFHCRTAAEPRAPSTVS